MRVAVTGADGFVGKYLCRHLCQSGDEVLALTGEELAPSLDGLPLAARRRLDITDRDSVRAAWAEVGPEAVIHLAGFSSVGLSHEQPERAFLVNTQGSVHVLAATRDLCPGARVLLVGSGEVYGALPAGARATESFPAAPQSPYAASKLAAEIAGFQFVREARLCVVSARSFNHLGRGQSPNFAVPAFARQLAAIRRGAQAPRLRVGDLSPVRDFSHVEDVVRAYRLLLLQGQPGEAYNVASGEGRSIRSLLEELIALSGVPASIEIDPARLRRSELEYLVGDPSKLVALGWARQHSVSEALAEACDEVGARAL